MGRWKHRLFYELNRGFISLQYAILKANLFEQSSNLVWPQMNTD
jgi:hypothetical protein